MSVGWVGGRGAHAADHDFLITRRGLCCAVFVRAAGPQVSVSCVCAHETDVTKRA